MTPRPRSRLPVATVSVVAGLGLGLAPALALTPSATAVTCDGGSGCVALASLQDVFGTLQGGPIGVLSTGSTGSASSSPTVVTPSTVTAFAQVESPPGEYSVGATLSPEWATGPLRIRVLHFPVGSEPGTVDPGTGLPYAPGDDELRDAWAADDLAGFSGAVVLDEVAPPAAVLPFRPAGAGLFVVVATYPGDPVTTPGIGLHRFLHEAPR